MAVEKQYMVSLKGAEMKTFSLGGGNMLTIKDGTIVPEGHVLVDLFPSFVVEIGERVMLEEAPVADAEPTDAEPTVAPEPEVAPVVVPEPEVAPVAPTKDKKDEKKK